MPFYEVIYETGSHSVLSADNDIDVQEGLKEHHRRALNGEVGGPAGHMAERVKRVLVYDQHPGDGIDFTSSPRVDPEMKHAHDSNYIMPESHEMSMEWLEA